MGRKVYGRRSDFMAVSEGLTYEVDLTPFLGVRRVEVGKIYFIPFLNRSFGIKRITGITD